MIVRVLVNETFKDKYNPKKNKYEAGKTYELDAERVKEIQSVRPALVTVLGEVPSAVEPEQPEAPEQPETSDKAEQTADKKAKK